MPLLKRAVEAAHADGEITEDAEAARNIPRRACYCKRARKTKPFAPNASSVLSALSVLAPVMSSLVLIRRLVPAHALLLLLAGACTQQSEANLETVKAPPIVQASFQTLSDSIVPVLSSVLDSAGYHAGTESYDSAAFRTPKVTIYVDDVSIRESRARVYTASISFDCHSHDTGPNGVAMPKFLTLEFATIGPAAKWALLTTDGYLYESIAGQESRDGRSDLPLDLQRALRDRLQTQLEIRNWWAYVESKTRRSDIVSGSRVRHDTVERPHPGV